VETEVSLHFPQLPLLEGEVVLALLLTVLLPLMEEAVVQAVAP
jgi:hypothetical protein